MCPDCTVRSLWLWLWLWLATAVYHMEQTCGVGWVVVNNGWHYGACSAHASRALAHGCIGISMTIGGNPLTGHTHTHTQPHAHTPYMIYTDTTHRVCLYMPCHLLAECATTLLAGRLVVPTFGSSAEVLYIA